ncbi:hypothetical protein [Paenibacillus peoriae]|uniref:hypothetical protein n=1 Tax=Paenibacillus peoriae TaxID=59893 RepID=UPI00215A8DC3|nr:hypothetical protein [Paenibacillus peoriae]
MNIIPLFDSSLNSDYFNNYSEIDLRFDLKIDETIRLIELKLADPTKKLRNVFDIKVQIKSIHSSLRKIIGEVQSNLLVFKQSHGQREWEWVLDSNDISIIENIRSRDLDFSVEVKAIVDLDENGINRTIPITGNHHIRIPETDWIRYIQHHGYSSKYGMNISTSLLNDPSWVSAYEQLSQAQEHLRRGLSYDALRQCLSVIESYTDGKGHGGPYSPKAWEEFLADHVEQKKDGITKLLTGVSTYLNKVGHHRHSRMNSEIDNLTPVPVDSYETELMLGITQLVVTYLERLKEK